MMKKYSIVLLLCLQVFAGFGQDISSYNKYYDATFKSPNVTDFIRYGNISAKMYTGELDLSIPLFSVPVKGQNNIDIALSYNASGFIPNKRSGITGLNWSMITGGMITREVKGEPDEHLGTPETLNDYFGPHGFISGIRFLQTAGVTMDDSQIFGTTQYLVPNVNYLSDMFYTMRLNPLHQNDKAFETTPDVFNFNFNGFSGKFFMGTDGKIKVSMNSSGNIKVDLSEFQDQYFYCQVRDSKIKITDDDGTIYYFGGTTDNLEYTTPLLIEDARSVINTWCLTKIEYRNNQTVTFNYKNDFIGTSPICEESHWHGATNHDEKRKFVSLNVFPNERKTLENSDISSAGGIGGGEITTSSSSYSSLNRYSITKKAILDNITGPDFKIQFTYSSQDILFHHPDDAYIGDLADVYNQYRLFKDEKIDKIALYNASGALVNSFDFQYSLKGASLTGNSFPRLFLEKVIERGKPAYEFQYDITTNDVLPKPTTRAVDYWGYYNGKLSNDVGTGGRLVPITKQTTTGDFIYLDNIREPDFNYAKIGQLKKVIYPTGGYSTFEYEEHKYTKRLERRNEGNFIPALYDVNGIAGGTRIKKIEDFDGINPTSANTKEYKYTLENTVSSTGSGLLMNWPRYILNTRSQTTTTMNSGTNTITTGSDISRGYIQSSSFTEDIFEAAIMNYSTVIETNSNEGYSMYKFKSYSEVPDLPTFPISGGNPTGLTQLTSGTYTPTNLVKNIYYMLNDYSIERGKIKSKKVFDKDGNTKQTADFVYNEDSNKLLLSSTAIGGSSAWYYPAKMYYYNDYLTKKIVKTTYASGIVSEEESYTYSTPTMAAFSWCKDLLINKISILNNETIEEKYKYPWDIPGLSTLGLFSSDNVITPLSESTYRNGVKLFEKYTEYAKDATTSNLLLPKNILAAKFPNTNNSLENKIIYNQYDTKGNVQQYTPDGGMPTTIIWGYYKTQPIAKIENETFANIPTATITNLQNLSETSTEANLILALNALRTSLPNAMVTTYTYLPLVGVSTITDPKEDKVTYNYDSYGRLINVKDNAGNILSENEYHFKN